ncbi:MAG: protein phosphatase 2C domain-containing protein [Anaerolineae bacterium]|nr:protein phosphatase 2C domain-containing protein [Anaerolineae bacterium]
MRAANEDRWAISVEHVSKKAGLYIVADGVGGHMAGGVAAELAIRTILDAFEAENLGSVSVDDLVRSVRGWVAFAQNAVLTAQKQKADYAIMGTTVVMAVLFNSKLVVANVGDSRCYLLRNSVLQQLSVDHSWLAEKLRTGEISEKDAKTNLNRNILARAIGSPDNATPDISVYDWQEGDRLLLCSDGLWAMLQEQHIANMLSKGTPEQAAENLLNASLAAGGDDNITGLVIGDVLNLPTRQQKAASVSEVKPDGGNVTMGNGEVAIKHNIPRRSATQRLIYFVGAFVLLCFSLSVAVLGGNWLRSGDGNIIERLFGSNPFIAPILGTPSDSQKNPTVVVIPGGNWAQISPVPTTPAPLVLPTLTQTPDKPTATITPALPISGTIRPVFSLVTTVTPTQNLTGTSTPIVAILATITPLGGGTPRPSGSAASVGPLPSITPRSAAVTSTATPAAPASPADALSGARLCQASTVLDGSCFRAATFSREFSVQDNEIYLYWQVPLSKGTNLRVQWLKSGRQLGATDSCTLGDTPCKNFDITANYVRLRIRDVQGDKFGSYGYKVFIEERLVTEGEFVIR